MVSLAKKQHVTTGFGEIVIGSKSLYEQNDFEKKYQTALKSGQTLEMVDWSTYVTPGTPGFIHGELLHPMVSGNGVDYTLDELIPAVNTLIKKPIYKVPNAFKGAQFTTSPDNLHKDPNKKIVGEVNLVKFKNGAINFLANVDDETYNESSSGLWPIGSIEANFVNMEESNKTGALFKPEFINFTGYLLLPSWATPGDPNAQNEVFEMVSKKFNTECPSKMLMKPIPLQKSSKISLAKSISKS